MMASCNIGLIQISPKYSLLNKIKRLLLKVIVLLIGTEQIVLETFSFCCIVLEEFAIFANFLTLYNCIKYKKLPKKLQNFRV